MDKLHQPFDLPSATLPNTGVDNAPLIISTIADDPPLVDIRSLDFIGSIEFSANKEFAVAFADNCRNEDGSLRGGSRNSGEGDVLLVKENRLVWRKKVPRPTQCVVSNSGDVLICDIGFGPNLQSNILVFRQDGSAAVNQFISANLLSCAVTPNGDFAFFNSAGSDTEEHSCKLFAYSLPSGTHVFTVDFPILFLAAASIDNDKLTVTAEGVAYQYSTSGVLLNAFEKDMALFERNMASGYFANAYSFLNQWKNAAVQPEQRGQLNTAYDFLIASNVPPEIKAKAHRDLGQVCLVEGNPVEAIERFREALRLNPKIGLKRKIAELEKRIGH